MPSHERRLRVTKAAATLPSHERGLRVTKAAARSLCLSTQRQSMSQHPQSKWLLRSVVTRLLLHMAHPRHVEVSWMQSSQHLFRLAVLFRGSCRGAMSPEDLVKRVKAAIEPGDKDHLFAATNVSGHTLLHWAAYYGLVDPVQQLIKAGGKKLLLATDMYGQSASQYDRVDC